MNTGIFSEIISVYSASTYYFKVNLFTDSGGIKTFQHFNKGIDLPDKGLS